MMHRRTTVLLRDTLAVLVVAAFMFPLFWWGLTSLKPASAIFDKDRLVWFDFAPTFGNYWVTLFGGGPAFFASQAALRDSTLVALGATLLTLSAALPAAWAVSLRRFEFKRTYLLWVLFQRIIPPIAIVLPLVFLYHQAGLRDTRSGIIFAHAAVNLPFAILMLKSFYDEVPRSVAEADPSGSFLPPRPSRTAACRSPACAASSRSASSRARRPFPTSISTSRSTPSRS